MTRLESNIISTMLQDTMHVRWPDNPNGGQEMLRLLQSLQPIKVMGPCALQSLAQVRAILGDIGQVADVIRAPDKKPRTRPVNPRGELLFHGIGHEAALPIYQEMRKKGVLIASEVMGGNDVDVLSGVLGLPWVGSRNTDQENIREIGAAAAKAQTPLMVKNPLVNHIETYLGMLENAILGSGSQVPVIACIRGLHPTTSEESSLWRNTPNLDWIDHLVQAFPGIHVILDSSHMVHKNDPHPLETQTKLIDEALGRGARGFMVEVNHPGHPSVTDPGVNAADLVNVILQKGW